jgi:hypothetical protein
MSYRSAAVSERRSAQTLQKEPGWGLSMSRDGKSIVYIQNDFSESNLMLVKNFH